jgi:hypothetical protein
MKPVVAILFLSKNSSPGSGQSIAMAKVAFELPDYSDIVLLRRIQAKISYFLAQIPFFGHMAHGESGLNGFASSSIYCAQPGLKAALRFR